MAVEYDTFVDSLQSLKEGEEIELIVRDTRTYEAKRVSAVLGSDRQRLSHGATLWIRFNQGILHPRPWMIQIKKEIGGSIENLA